MADWLIKNKQILNVSGLEKEIGCPPTTLQKVLQGAKPLPHKWAVRLHERVLPRLKSPIKDL